MVWTRLQQQQQRGAQLPSRSGKGQQQAGEAPEEAVADRAAQDHERAGGNPQPGEAPASALENRDGDNTPTAPEPSVQWDEVVQPERTDAGQEQQGERREDEAPDDLPLPEGK